MVTTVNPHLAPAHSAVLVENPQGKRELIVVTAFDDHAAAGQVMGDFDGQEKLTARVPVRDQRTKQIEARDIPYDRFVGSDGRLDTHVLRIPQDIAPGKRLSLTEIRAGEWRGIAVAADLHGPQSGDARAWLTQPGANIPVYDVGKVDKNGLSWAGNVEVREVRGLQTVLRPFVPGETIEWSNSLAGSRNNRELQFEVYAPGKTELSMLPSSQQIALASSLKVRAVSDYFAGGQRPLTMMGSGGIDGHNFRMGFSLNDAENFQGGSGPPPGQYPVQLMAGDMLVGSFTIDWKG